MTARRGDGPGRALRPWVERFWSREKPGAAALALRPLASLYGIAADLARARAARSRAPVEGLAVIAIGGLAVGGAGKTSIARWAARQAASRGFHPAILLRGYGSDAARSRARIVPVGGALGESALPQFGDEALAHRAALPAEIAVVTCRDRGEGARAARTLGADLAILDDGWEQGSLAWDSLWVALDPVRPLGNGLLLPAGPLRRRPHNLSEANAIIAIAETKDEGESPALAAAARAHAPGVPLVRFRRAVEGIAPLLGGPARGLAECGPALVVSSIGSPARLDRFLRGVGVEIALHVAFADHGAWDPATIRIANSDAVRLGAKIILVTDKDAHRALRLPAMDLEILVLATGITPVDDPEPLLRSLPRRPAPPVAAPAAIG